jgi:hypothetical protein
MGKTIDKQMGKTCERSLSTGGFWSVALLLRQCEQPREATQNTRHSPKTSAQIAGRQRIDAKNTRFFGGGL